MRKTSRIILAAMSLVSAILAFIYLLYALRRPVIVETVKRFIESNKLSLWQIPAIGILIVVLLFSTFSFLYSIFAARLKKSRSKNTDIGMIDIGVGAIENIALNSAKAAQAGIKTAKARVYASNHEEIEIELSVVLYSDVEIPLQMAKIQDRVKKDVEKYTGIGVRSVKVKVTRVELLGTVVER